MLNNPFFKLLTKVIGNVQKGNEENPDVETADASVFSNVLKRAEKTTNEVETGARDRGDLYREMARQVEEARRENEEDENVTTAHSSVFEDMVKQIEELKAQQAEAGGSVAETVDNEMIEVGGASSGAILETYTEADKASYINAMATVSSNGGSLALRLNPDMGSPTNSVRVPHDANIRILQNSDKSIMLDGKKSNWVMIEFDGQQGWILDSYIGNIIRH